MSYLGIAISLWTMIVPHHFTLEQAAASQSTQAFLLVGTLVLLPVILLYTGWVGLIGCFAARCGPMSDITEQHAGRNGVCVTQVPFLKRAAFWDWV
jgi:hypothetical protein